MSASPALRRLVLGIWGRVRLKLATDRVIAEVSAIVGVCCFVSRAVTRAYSCAKAVGALTGILLVSMQVVTLRLIVVKAL